MDSLRMILFCQPQFLPAETNNLAVHEDETLLPLIISVFCCKGVSRFQVSLKAISRVTHFV